MLWSEPAWRQKDLMEKFFKNWGRNPEWFPASKGPQDTREPRPPCTPPGPGVPPGRGLPYEDGDDGKEGEEEDGEDGEGEDEKLGVDELLRISLLPKLIAAMHPE